jgi:hypothetical protein
MAAQLATSRNVFGPSEIARLSLAYEAAISTVTEETTAPSEGLTALEIRRQLASVIIAEAKQGQLDPERLKDAALHSLASPSAKPNRSETY